MTEELKKVDFAEYVKTEPIEKYAEDWPKDRFVFLTDDGLYHVSLTN